jgi:uncharacterized protein (DUF1697 family)
MSIYLALLRGINVGGHNIIKMDDLKNVLTNIGLDHVKTYIQSGNVFFKSEKTAEQLQNQIELEIQENFGLSVPVILRTASEFEQMINDCPYPVNSLSEGESIHVALLAEVPSQEGVKQFLKYKSELEDCHIRGKEVYLFLQISFHKSKLSSQLQKLGVHSTVRNWKTIKKLETMANGIEL